MKKSSCKQQCVAAGPGHHVLGKASDDQGLEECQMVSPSSHLLEPDLHFAVSATQSTGIISYLSSDTFPSTYSAVQQGKACTESRHLVWVTGRMHCGPLSTELLCLHLT